MIKNTKAKIRDYVYFSTYHILGKIVNKNRKEKTFDTLLNLVFIVFLGFYSFVLKIIQAKLDITIELNNYYFVILLLLIITIIVINLSLKKVYKNLNSLSDSKILQSQLKVERVILNWLFPLIAILSLVLLGFLVSMEL